MKELDIGSATSTIILISGYGTNLQAILDEIVATPYKYGFTTDLETEEFEKGLNKTQPTTITNAKSINVSIS